MGGRGLKGNLSTERNWLVIGSEANADIEGEGSPLENEVNHRLGESVIALLLPE